VDEFNLFDPDVFCDPYPFYATLREQEPVHYSRPLDAWLLSRYEDVVDAFRAPDALSSAPRGGTPRGARFLLGSDPPEHTSLRRVVNRFFVPSAVGAVEPRIREVARALIDDLVKAGESGEADLMRHVANPLPVIVIAELMGIPPERRDDFKRWSDATIGGVDMNPREIAQTTIEMNRYFGEVIDRRGNEPGDDLISRLITTGEQMTRQELQMFCALLLIAGNETTTNLIGNLVLALLSAPDQVGRLREDPSLIPAAVEETMRYDAPVQAVWRLTTDEIVIRDIPIPAGARVLLLQGSANRDPEAFPRPDCFDMTRDARDHVGFGAGIHFCLGTHLAHLEARVITEVLLERVTDLRQAGPGERIIPAARPRVGATSRRPRVRRNPVVRGMRSLPVTFTATN
jgi:cytochrome P450